MAHTLFDLMVALYAAAVGLVAAGLTVSLYQMLTDRTAGFVLLGQSLGGLVASFMFFAVTGPILVMRETGPEKGHRSSPGWLAFRIGMVAIWSCCSGILLLEIAMLVGQKVS